MYTPVLSVETLDSLPLSTRTTGTLNIATVEEHLSTEKISG
jgi:hypothetical protein